MEDKREYRMYGLVPYNLSPIQQGIQFGHAVVEYSLKYTKDSDYQKWAKKDKTFIILNGGTTNSRRYEGKILGSLNRHSDLLESHGIKIAKFFEPDLEDCLTSVVFLADDRVWDREKWPNYEGIPGSDLLCDRYKEWKDSFNSKDDSELKSILFLREFLPGFKLA
jgi:hypothetical protein